MTSLLIDGAKITALDPPADTKADAVLDAGGSAVMPGLVDGHIHPVFGEWTPTQDTIGWIGNYVHGGTTTMVSACELHVPGLDYENLSPDLVTSLDRPAGTPGLPGFGSIPGRPPPLPGVTGGRGPTGSSFARSFSYAS